MVYTQKELQEKCNHNLALRQDYWFKARCCGCSVLKWNWQWKRIKKNLRNESKFRTVRKNAKRLI